MKKTPGIIKTSWAVSLLAAAGCQSLASKEIKLDHQPYEPIINAQVLTIQPISINGALTSEKVLHKAIAHYKPYVAGEIKILDCDYIDLDLGENNAVSGPQLDKIVNAKDFGPTRITIVFCPDIDFFSKKKFYQFARQEDNPKLTWHLIFINTRTCNKAACSIPFISSESLTSLVLLHELCHALNVPARKNHMMQNNERHCANTNCILYPKIDLQSVLSGILRLGPPTQLCKMCREEVFAVQKNFNNSQSKVQHGNNPHH